MKNEHFDEKSEFFLKEYLKTPSPSGFESEAQKLWIDYIKPYVDKCYVDSYGNAVGIINEHLNGTYKVMIESHVDEIGWSVKYISEDGFIYVEKIGSPDVLLAPGQRVNIHTDNGIVKGGFGFTALHIRERDKKISESSLVIDVGCLKKSEVIKLGIEVGNPITPDVGCEFINGNKILSRGIDNKIGGFALASLLRYIKENDIKLDFSLYVTNSVQEEVGKHGATMIVDTIKPNLAIVTDVTHDTSTPGVSNKLRGSFKISKGPVINTSPLIHKGLLKYIKNMANKNNIPYQLKSGGKKTGTDADVIALSNGGTPTSLISTPIRYMHTPNEICCKTDVNDLINIILYTIVGISKRDFVENLY